MSSNLSPNLIPAKGDHHYCNIQQPVYVTIQKKNKRLDYYWYVTEDTLAKQRLKKQCNCFECKVISRSTTEVTTKVQDVAERWKGV